jgi:acetoin utilization deacetylase AcuC-like enzyme
MPGLSIHGIEPASFEQLLRVHTAEYLELIRTGALDHVAALKLGLPASEALLTRSRLEVAGTLAATAAALEDGLACNLAGGTHHAFPDRGEGFCTFNDVAVAIRRLQRDGRVRRVVIVDLDVHQGNGTHGCFAGDPQVYTFSMHGAKNFPFHKVPGTLDVELDDGTGDAEYLALLAAHLPTVLREARPDLVVYLAGADPHEGDKLGRLKLTFEGLHRRDAFVVQMCREIGVPVCATMSGGYGRDVRDTVEVHLNTVRVLRSFAGR